MTTGEKIAKLRKEQHYTQEQLAEVLNVSRQSVSKWESDTAFPETAKLIELSNLFHCSIDYLVKASSLSSPEPIFAKEEKAFKTSFLQSPHVFTSIWSAVYFILLLIIFSFPYVIMEFSVNLSFFDSTFTERFNLYDLLSSGNYQIGNFLVLLAFLMAIAVFVLSIYILFAKDKAPLFKTRKILAMVDLGIWVVMFFMFAYAFQIGMLLIIILSLANLIGLLKIEKNRYIVAV